MILGSGLQMNQELANKVYQTEMQEQFEDMFKQMAAAAGESEPGATGAESSSAKSDTPGKNDASFQETIRRTMERMQTSGEQATAAATAGSGDDFMSELLKQMSSGDLGGEGGEGGEEEFSKMLMGMMEQLTNKEILYEPMKELDDKFPEWFEKNKSSTPPEDLKRYEEQKALVREIVAKFEETSYSDSNAADREYIVDRMQKVCDTRQARGKKKKKSMHVNRWPLTFTTYRCKLRAHLRQTWSGTWPQRKRRLGERMTNATRNNLFGCFGYNHARIYTPYTRNLRTQINSYTMPPLWQVPTLVLFNAISVP